ncbi:MAG: hypothetical protein M5U01_21670 [Ardenticatenaceae bacterium]|nr:hypothetical protein [Ardenticatenaceae bacterium]
MEARAEEPLVVEYGTRRVRIVEPESQRVTVDRADAGARSLAAGDHLDGEDGLRFTFRVERLVA